MGESDVEPKKYLSCAKEMNGYKRQEYVRERERGKEDKI
jgi:hypothetical protein